MLGLAGLLLITTSSWGQNTAGYGDWQLHLPTNHPLHLADAGDRVYVVTENSFYFLDKNQNTTQTLSSRDGLSDVGVVAVAYDSVTKQTVLAYKNGNIDILRPNGSVRNLGDVLRKLSQGSIQAGDAPIKQLSIAGGKAYLSTSFGVVVIDLAKLEISNTYTNIGPGGSVVTVYDATSNNGYLYLATSAGLMRGRLTDNLLDYNSWRIYTPTGPAATNGSTYPFVVSYGSQVYAAAGGSVYKYALTTDNWVSVNNTYTGQFRKLRTTGAGVLIINDDYGVRLINRNETLSTIIPPADILIDAVRIRDGSYYLANYYKGLQRIKLGAGGMLELYAANGPTSAYAFSLLADARSNKVNIFTGQYSERYFPSGRAEGFYEYAAGQWTNFNSQAFPSLTDFPNPTSPVRGTRTPNGTLYVANYGGGLLEWNAPGNFRLFGEGIPAGSPLFGTFGLGNSRVEITDLLATTEGKVWVVNRHMIPRISGLSLFDPSANTWQTIPYVDGLDALERIALDDNGYVWASVARKSDRSNGTKAALGIFAIDPTNTNPPRFFTSSSGLPSEEIYELAKDRRGYIWAATIKGVAVFNDPSGPFLSQLGFSLPIVRRGDGTGFPALFSESVRCLAVDGGDRKWFGTDNGLWLFSPDADEALLHFTTDNSPLPSNRIVDVKVNDKTGDVWVATDAGVVSYRGSATVTEGAPHCSAVFPNPVRPDFAGTVGISGLANNALVKITDVAGHLVYATTASGGTVTWNMTNPSGERVRSGIYLVLSSDADGKNGCVSKVAVLSK
ncbi:hypothetical protein [Hymenobacter negativus]|uniref:type IX secretion system anionic LPS delivery protein PorZ n=1 Tax=Hymenobacter negativus TaxID=2795026 RepID=UPI001AAF4411|nr:hypothetical protein [Hymenobacter negativus]